MTIRWKTWLITFGFMLLVLSVFGWAQHQVVSNKLDTQMLEKIEAYVAQKSSEINSMIEVRCSQLDLLSQLIERQGPDNASGIDEWMRLMTAGDAVEAVSIIYYDANGKVIKSNSYSYNHDTHLPQEHTSYLQGIADRMKATDKGQWFTSALPNGKSGLVLQYVRKVNFKDKGTVLVGLVFETEGLKKIAQGMQISSRDYGILLDERMNFFYHPTFKQGTNLREAYNGQFIKVADYMSQHPEKGRSNYKWFDNRVKTFVYQQLSNGWYIGLTVFREDVNVTTMDQKLLLEGLAVAWIGAVLLSLLLAAIVNSPTRGMLLVLQDMALGHYGKAVSPRYLKRNDEMGAMANAIEKMRILQQDHLEGLREYQELVENKVLEKMASLSKANEALEHSLAMMEDKNQELQGVESICLESQNKWDQAQSRLYQAEQVLIQGAVLNSAIQYFEQEKENVIGLTVYLKQEIEKSERLTEQMDYQNLLDGTDLIMQRLSAFDPILKQLAEMGALHMESNDTFNVREILLKATQSLGITDKKEHIEVLILCDHDETMRGDAEIFERIVSLLIEVSLFERLKRTTVGHIYIKLENKGDYKKMAFSGNFAAKEDEGADLKSLEAPNRSVVNLYLQTVEELLAKYFNGRLTSEQSRGEGQLYHLVFKDYKF